MPTLRFIRGADWYAPGQQVHLKTGRTALGRWPESEVLLGALSVSKRHAQITCRGELAVLEDLKSRNGTYLNGEQIKGPTPLQSGDMLRIGPCELLFVSLAASQTSADWLASTNSQGMLDWLRANSLTDARLLWLFVAACCREFDLLRHVVDEDVGVELVEDHAEGKILAADLPLGLHSADSWRSAVNCISHAVRTAYCSAPRPEEELWADYTAVEERLCVLVRDIQGNPFHDPYLDPGLLAWEDGLVVRLAQAACDHRDTLTGRLEPDRLAILGDALEDAGGVDANVLAHLRSPGPHVRGCWVVDLLLGEKRCSWSGEYLPGLTR